jgi:anthranilate phosphoribosyltransferase
MGDERVPAKEGVTIKQLCSEVELNKNIHYFDRANYLKELSSITRIRSLLSVRTGINTLEKLPKLGNSQFAITGVFHQPYVLKYNEIFKGRYKRFALLKGNEGAPEIFSKARLWITEADTTTEFIIDPSYYGINYDKSVEGIGLNETLEVLKDPSADMIKLARLNGAIYLLLANQTESIEEGFEKLTKL